MAEIKTKETVLEAAAKNGTMINGSEAVIRCLLEENVSYIFGYPGGAIMPIYDALYHYQDKVTHILTRHEQGAIHAAQGYARVTGDVGVCFATSGPGATNLITGIADAKADSTPVVCITGQVAYHLIGTDAFQETDVIGISMPVTKWNWQVTNVNDIPEILAKAFYIARSGRPGPVLVDIAKNAQMDLMNFHYKKCEKIRSYVPKPQIRLERIKQAAEIINNAKKPMVLAGQGIILGNAEEEMKAFIKKSGMPVASTLLGLSVFESDHPQYVGMLGMHGNYAPNKLTNDCDVIVAVGMRFDDRVTGDAKKYAPNAHVIHLDIDPAEINKIIKATVGIVGDVKESLPILTNAIKQNSHTEWIKKFREFDKIEYDKVIKGHVHPTQEKLTMGEAVHLISEKANKNAVLVTDVGQHQMIATRYFKFKQTRSNITSGGLGTMGFALPAAFGAKTGAPEREVIAIIGDGGFQMTLQELATIKQTETNVKIVILNNNFLGMVRQWQQLFFSKRYSFVEITSPDYIKLADSYGIKGKKVTKREELAQAIDEMLNHPHAFLLEVVVEQEENVFPMIPTGTSVSEILLEPSK